MTTSKTVADRITAITLGLGLGLGVGALGELALFWDELGSLPRLALGGLTGALLGGLGPALYDRLRRQGINPTLEPIQVQLPGLVSVTLHLDDETHRQIAWTLFVEISSRVVTQPLEDRAGNLREAINSLHKVFALVRGQLRSSLPSALTDATDKAGMSVESYALGLLNEALRPFLSRWHPRLQEWEASGKPEDEWPLQALCRRDLEATRQAALVFAEGLGRAAQVGNMKHLLPLRGEPVSWTDDATLAAAERSM